MVTHHHGQTLPACKRNQTISVRLTDCKHGEKKKIEITGKKIVTMKFLWKYMFFHINKDMMNRTYHNMGRDKFQNINYLQEI